MQDEAKTKKQLITELRGLRQRLAESEEDKTELKRTEQALKEGEEKFRQIVEHMQQVFWIANHELDRILYVSPAYEKIWGCTCESLYQNPRSWAKALHPADRKIVKEAISRRASDGLAIDYRIIRPNGEVRWIRDIGIPVHDGAGHLSRFAGMAEDITERKQAVNAVLKANRVIKGLWECNNALIHAKDELQLLHEICRVIVEVCGYKMAWVGFAEHDDGRTVSPVAQYGYEDGYLEKANVTWQDTERGRGPVGTSIRKGVPVVMRDVEQQPEFAPWREEAVKRGYVSVIGLPVFAEGSVLGCLTIYAEESDSFDADEVNLLSKLALNLSFGIETLRTSQARKQAENELQRSRDELERRVEERTAALEKANEELRQIPSKLISFQEEERKRLASELHDSIGQTLAAVKFWIEMVLKLRDAGDGTAALNHLEQFVPILQHSIEETRSIYMGLRPSMLDTLGLLATLEWLRGECMKLYPDRHIELETGIAEGEIPESLKVNIFRIAQEALNNIAKHSNAEWVDISISRHEGKIELVVSDDGMGMEPDHILQTGTARSLGLTGMRERAKVTGGSFSIESTPGDGTTIRACWPFEAED